MAYTCEIRSSIDQTDLAAWNAVRADHNDPFVDPRFVRAVEHGLASEGKYATAIVRDELGQPAAIASLSVLPLDLAILAGGPVKKLAAAVRSIFPNALRYPAIFCGLPVSVGQNQLRFAPQANRGLALESLDLAMRDLARQHRARFIILKEFDDAECRDLVPLETLGYYRADSLPMNHLEPRFTSFAGYLAALKAPYRSKIVRSQRKFADAGLRVETLTEGAAIAAIYSDDIHRLYQNVVAKSPVHLEKLSAEWFREMARLFDRESIWTAIYREDRLLAFAYGLLAGEVYYSFFGGVDYESSGDSDAYFNLMHYELDFALGRGVRDIQLGQTADDYKARLGCRQRRLSFFVKPLRWKAALALKLAPDKLLPKHLPPVERHVFQQKHKATQPAK